MMIFPLLKFFKVKNKIVFIKFFLFLNNLILFLPERIYTYPNIIQWLYKILFTN